MSEKPHVSELQALRLRIYQLEKEADNRVRLYCAEETHREATVKSFATRCLATAVAWVTSDMVYEIILVFVDVNAAKGVTKKLTRGEEFLARSCYAVFCCLFCPGIIWVLRPASAHTKGFSFQSDFLKLVAGCTPMILMWSLMNLVVSLMAWADNRGWDELLTAVILTFVMGLLEYTPGYKEAKAAVDGEGDSMLGRYKILPSYAVLAVGKMWNDFFTWPVAELQKKVPGQPNIDFIIQLIYFVLVSRLIIFFTAWWSEKNEALSKQFGEEEDEKHHLESPDHHTADIERTMGQFCVTSVSFVYAWALNSTLVTFFFSVMCGCSSASTCGPSANCAYAAILTVAFTYYAGTVQFQERRHPWGRAHQSLQILALSLCVGWAWKGYLDTLIAAVEKETGYGRVILFAVLFVLFWVLAGWWWHSFLIGRRRRLRQRERDFKRTEVDVAAVEDANADRSLTSI